MNLVTDPRNVAISDGDSDASSSAPSSYTSRSSMDDLLERALLHGFDRVTRDNGVGRPQYTVDEMSPSHSFDQVNIFQGARRAGLPGSAQRGLRQRMDVQVDTGARSDDDEDDDEALALIRRAAHQQQESTSMARFRQTLEEMRAREFGTPDGSTDDASPKAKKARRKPDEGARARLVEYNASMKAKVQEKYMDRVAREAAERESRQPPRVSPVATRAGQRLYLQSKGRDRVVDELREEKQKRQEEEEAKACTFEPTITAYAHRFAQEGGYVDPADGLERDAERKEALQRKRLAKEAAVMDQCPFQPTLSPHTNAIIAARRQRATSRSRGNSRGRREDGVDTSSHEPFAAGERLYRDGGERLLRQQIRQRLAERRAEGERVGQHVLLSAAHAKQVTGRLEAWQRAKERNLAFLRHDAEATIAQQAQGVPSSSAASSRPLSRSQSAALTDRLSAPKRPASRTASTSSRGGRGVGTTRATSTGPRSVDSSVGQHRAQPLTRSVSAGSAATAGSNRTQASARRLTRASSQPSNRTVTNSTSISTRATAPTDARAPQQHRTRHPGESPLRETGTFRGRWNAQELTPAQTKLQQEFRRIRCGALFYKYAPTPASETLCCRDVRRQVNLYYPEDAGLAEALRLRVSGELVPMTKSQFVDALEAFESAHGPQTWGRTEKDKLLFPVVAAAAASSTTQADGRRGRVAGSRPTSVPLSRQSSVGSSSTKRVAGQVALQREPGGGTARSVSAASRSSSARDGTRTRNVHATRGELDSCTFKPKLSAQTQRLSEIDRQRRVNYAAERELRRRALQLLPSACGRQPQPGSSHTPPSGEATTQAGKAPPAIPDRGATSTDPQLEVGAGATRGHSPSVELSSLSGSSPSSQERSAAAAVASAAARRAQRQSNAAVPPAPTATETARRELEALLLGFNKGTTPTGTVTPPPATTQPRPTPAMRGFASQPQNALLSVTPTSSKRVAAVHAASPLRERRHDGEDGVSAAAAPAVTATSTGASPTQCGVDELYNVLYRGAWF